MIKQLKMVLSTLEPENKNVIWVKPLSDKLYSLYVNNGGDWISIIEEGILSVDYNKLLNKPTINGKVLTGNISYDTKMSDSSINALQNKIITSEISSINLNINNIMELVTVNVNDINKLNDKVFPLSVAVSASKTLCQIGTSNEITLTITTKRGDDKITPDSMTINDTKVTNFTSYTETLTASKTYTVKATKGNKTVSASVVITFVNNSYSGVVSSSWSATEANIKALTGSLVGSRYRTITLSPNNQKIVIAYPKAFGAAASIKDGNGFDYLASYTKSEVTVNNEPYYVYVLTNATTVTNLKQIIA